MIIQLEGTLESGRDKKFEARSSKVQKILITKAAEVWYQKMLAAGWLNELRTMSINAAVSGKKLRVVPYVYRYIPIRDFKNAVTGFDHMILDPLVRAGVLLGDTENAIEWDTLKQFSACEGMDYVKIGFDVSVWNTTVHYRKKALQLQREGGGD